MEGVFQSAKIIDGFSTCFRQWIADTTHCKFLHGYSIYFKVTYEGELDQRSWVQDHGGMKRSSVLIDGMKPKEWMDYMFDHTTVIAQDDPEYPQFASMAKRGALQLRVLPKVGCERFAELVFRKVNRWVREETEGRVKVVSVECFEHSKNSATYYEQ
jgi:6-pyruvoyltetrahydropterin/6-carboxytetrahydropterin synthase